MFSSKPVFRSTLLVTVLCSLFSVQAFARKSSEICSKPKFTHFKPGDRAEVAPGSEFSFRTSDAIAKTSVKATVKGIPVELQADDRETFYYFSGHMPEQLKDTYARVKVSGEVKLGCDGTKGWLIKIKPE